MPNRSFSTLASGARQFVVHDAFEITVCCRGVEHGVVDAEADRGVGVAARRGDDHPLDATPRCPAAVSRPVKRPVDSMTTSTPWSAHGISAGSVTPSCVIVVAVDREAVVAGLDLVAQRAADGVVLEQERHRLAVAMGSLTATSSTPRRLPPRQQRPGEGAADPPEAVDPDTNVIAVPPWTAPCGAATTAEPEALSPICPGIVGQPVGPGHVRRPTGSTPRPGSRSSSAASAPSRW